MLLKYSITILFAMLLYVCNAQDYKLAVSSATNTEGIQLKWLTKTPVENASFNIYRKESSAWIKINSSPITASPVIQSADLKTPKNPFPNDTTYSFYIELKNDKNLNATGNALYYLYLAATFNNNIAKHLGIYFIDNSAETGKSYTYKLTPGNSDKELAVSDKINYTAFSKPAAPSGLKGNGGDKKIDFFWTDNDDFIAYNLYVKDNNTAKKINKDAILINRAEDVKSPLYKLNNLENGKSYSYQLSGLDYFGNESELSSVITVTPEDNVAPHAVRNLQVRVEKNNILLQWQPSISDDIKGYNVFKSSDEKSKYIKINSTALSSKDTMFTDKNITADGNTNFYYLESFDVKNNSSKSDTVSAFLPDQIPPSMPKNAASRVESGKVSISWSKNTETDLAGYRIYRGLKDDDENSMALLNSKPRKETTFTDTFPKEAGTKFIYKIRAMDISFNESEPSVVIAQLPDVIAPAAAFLEEAKYNDGKVTLRWKASNNKDIKGYKILRKTESETEFKTLNQNFLSATETTYEDKSITKNANYQYAVQAIDSAGNSSPKSNFVFVMTIGTSTSFANPNLSARYDKANKQVILKYNVDAKNDNIEGYVIYRKQENTNPKQLFTPDKTGNYTDKKIEEDKTYFYYIKTFFISGDISEAGESVKVETR